MHRKITSGFAGPADRVRRLVHKLMSTEIGWAMADQVVISGSTFLVGVAAARLLGIQQFGRFTLILLVASILQAIHNSTIIVPMMTFAGQRKRSANYYAAVLAIAMLMALMAGIVLALTIALIFGLRDGHVPWSLAVGAGAYAAVQNFHLTVRRMNFAQMRAWGALVLDMLRYVLMAVIVAGAIWLGAVASIELLLAGLTASALLSLAPFVPWLNRGRVRGLMLRTVRVRHWQFGSWLVAMSFVTFASEQLIAVGVGVLINDEALGGLRAGQYLLGATHFIVMAMEGFMPGGAARAYAAGKSPELCRYLIRQKVVFGLPNLMILLVLGIFAEPCLTFILGPGYGQFAIILRIYAASYACIFIRDVWTHYFRAIQRTDVIFHANVAGAVASAALFYPCIVKWGAPGAAFVIFAAHFVSTVYTVAAARYFGATFGWAPLSSSLVSQAVHADRARH